MLITITYVIEIMIMIILFKNNNVNNLQLLFITIHYNLCISYVVFI